MPREGSPRDIVTENDVGNIVDSLPQQVSNLVVGQAEFERQYAHLQKQLAEQQARNVDVQVDIGESAAFRVLKETVNLQREQITLLLEKNRSLVERITQLDVQCEDLADMVRRYQSRLVVDTVEAETQTPEYEVEEDRLSDLLGHIEGLAVKGGVKREPLNKVGEVAATPVANSVVSLTNSFPAVNFIATFSGKNNENVESFLQNIRDVGRLCQWPDGFLVNVLRLKLMGDARTFVESVAALRDATHFEVLAQGLIQRFTDKRGTSYYRDQLSTMRQKAGEGYDAYADRIRSISCKTYTLTGDAVRNEVLLEEAEARAVDVFIRGIDPQIGGEVKVSSPTTLHEAVRLAMLREEARRFVAAPMRSREPKRVFAQEARCGRCKRDGHNADECLAPYCPHCRSMGHLGMHCRQNQNRQRHNRYDTRANRGNSQNRQGNGRGAGVATPPRPH